MKNILITFGCSWTYGEGSGYEFGIDESTYENKIRYNEKLCYENSWRKSIIDYFKAENINHSVPGSSNQRQFKEAKRFFISDQWKELAADSNNNIVVLWGTTSTARNYMWCRDVKQYCNLFLNHKSGFNKYQDKLSVALNTWSYDKKIELRDLELDMLFWNDYFKKINVKNLWFDTFNHHTYQHEFTNLLDFDVDNRDLLSYLCKKHNMENNIVSPNSLNRELSNGNNFKYAEKYKLINPYSFHPTKLHYAQLGDYFIDKLKNYF